MPFKKHNQKILFLILKWQLNCLDIVLRTMICLQFTTIRKRIIQNLKIVNLKNKKYNLKNNPKKSLKVHKYKVQNSKKK